MDFDYPFWNNDITCIKNLLFKSQKKKINIDINLSIKAPHCCLKFGQNLIFLANNPIGYECTL